MMDQAQRSRPAGALRDLLKRSQSIYGLYKFARLYRQVSAREWANLRRTVRVVRVLPNTMLSAARLLNAYDCMAVVEREAIDGAVVECGVWMGGAIGLMASVSKGYGNRTRIFHLFDSFEGLPRPSIHDVEAFPAFRAEHPELGHDQEAGNDSLTPIGACVAPLTEVRRLFEHVLKIDPRQVVAHVGWFQKTVPIAAASMGPLAILRLDADWYESTRVCLEGLYDNVVPGGFVIIDDYSYFTGCRIATDEFIRKRGIKAPLIDIDGVGIFFKKPGD